MSAHTAFNKILANPNDSYKEKLNQDDIHTKLTNPTTSTLHRTRTSLKNVRAVERPNGRFDIIYHFVNIHATVGSDKHTLIIHRDMQNMIFGCTGRKKLTGRVPTVASKYSVA